VRIPALTSGSSSATSTLVISAHPKQNGDRKDYQQQDAHR
jgi:hypothetical protein